MSGTLSGGGGGGMRFHETLESVLRTIPKFSLEMASSRLKLVPSEMRCWRSMWRMLLYFVA
eukprot:9591385-Heterocapsa_arctica.AAC.1